MSITVTVQVREVEPMRLVAYLRVSTTAQAVDGYGLDVQRAEVTKWAKANGHRIVRWCSDEGVSGTTEAVDRPGLSCALSAIEDGDAAGVVVARLDRLARSLTIQEAVLAHLWHRGASAFTADAGEIVQDDPDDPMRRAMRQMVGVFSELERNMVVLRMRRGRAAKATAGGWAYGAPPMGYEAREGVLVADESERETVDLIVSLKGEGKSLREIAVLLEDQGRPTKRGGRWQPTTIARILRREGAAA
jgi:DNA invertase Pin-like site-specific DNA recombinase